MSKLEKQIENKLPNWHKAVNTGDTDIVLTIDAFLYEPELLRDALIYAGRNGTTVIFAPEIGKK